MIDSAKFVIEKTIQPALDLYKQAKTYNHMSSNELTILKTAADKAQNAKNVVQNFKKTGDLYSYLKVLIRSGEEELAIEFRKIGLVPFEDIISEFEKRFELELHNISDVKDLINEEIYSTWDIIFLAKIYRAKCLL